MFMKPVSKPILLGILSTILITLFLVSHASGGEFDDYEIKIPSEIVIDVSKLNVSAEQLRRAAIKAYLSHQWQVEEIRDSAVVAIQRRQYKAVIDFESDSHISIAYAADTDAGSDNWLNNLRRAMLLELANCANLIQPSVAAREK